MSRIDTATSSPTWRKEEILIGILQHATGLALVLAAWVLVFTDHARAAGSALLPGLLIVTLYGANQIRFRAVLERAVLLVGAWTLVAPWALGFAANDGATWAHIALGGVAIATSMTLLRIARRP
ncbi:SPW repeat protein [Methylobacterium mesophilicum]